MGANRDDRFERVKDAYKGYEVYDRDGQKIGKADDLFRDRDGALEYIEFKRGFLGRKSTLIPVEIVRVDEEQNRIELDEDKRRIEEGPGFDDDEPITPEFEESIRSHYNLQSRASIERDRS